MRPFVFLAFLLASSPAMADTVSPDGCRILAESAEGAANSIHLVIERMKSNAMENTLPVLPPRGKTAAERMLKAQADAIGPIGSYAASLDAFAAEMRHCAGQ